MQLDFTSDLLPHLCACGCGQSTKISPRTISRRGIKKGDPLRFISGHNKTRINSAQDVWNKIDVGNPDECWLFTAKAKPKGYGVIRVAGKIIRATRLVYDLCYGIKDPKSDICHTCDVPLCCNPLHLFEASHLGNMQDAAIKGRMCKGSAISRAKLTEGNIPNIRTLISNGYSDSEIGKEFGVTSTTIYMIKTGRNWKHVPY